VRCFFTGLAWCCSLPAPTSPICFLVRAAARRREIAPPGDWRLARRLVRNCYRKPHDCLAGGAVARSQRWGSAGAGRVVLAQTRLDALAVSVAPDIRLFMYPAAHGGNGAVLWPCACVTGHACRPHSRTQAGKTTTPTQAARDSEAVSWITGDRVPYLAPHAGLCCAD